MPTNPVNMTREQLEAEQQRLARLIADADAEQQRRNDADAARLRAAQDAYDRRILATHQAEHDRLDGVQRDHEQAIVDRLADGDLAGAVDAWVDRRAARWQQYQLRTAATNAVNRQGTGSAPSILYYGEADLLASLERAADVVATQRGNDRFDATTGQQPVTLDDLEPDTDGQAA